MPAIIPLVVAGVGAAASAYAAHKSSGAVSDAANTQTTAANYAAKLQSEAAQKALAFQQQQAAIDQANFQKTQSANYGQFQTASNENYGQYAAGAQTDYDRWALHQNNMGYLGQLLGLPARQLPAAHIAAPPVYGANPFDTSGGTTATGGGNQQSIMDALKANYKSLGYAPTGPGSGPTDIAYFADAASRSAAAGERPLSYWLGPNGRVAQEIAQAGLKPTLGGNG